MAMASCSECGNQISDKAKKCIHCGKVFDENVTELNEKICKECGNPLLESLTECPNCGCPVMLKSKDEHKITKKAKIIFCTIIGVVIISCVGVVVCNIPPVKNYIVETKQDMMELITSKKAFKEAEEAESNNDYELAITKYKAVIEKDKSYENAQNKVAELQEVYKSQLLSEAESYEKDKKYDEAIQTIDKAIAFFGPSNELTELKQNYRQSKLYQYAKVVVVDKLSHPANYLAGKFMESISLILEITNNSPKSIKGIEGIMETYDLFGKQFMSDQCDFPFNDAAETGKTFYTYVSLDCNPYDEGQMKLYNTDFSNLKFFYNITKVVYDDGTTVELK